MLKRIPFYIKKSFAAAFSRKSFPLLSLVFISLIPMIFSFYYFSKFIASKVDITTQYIYLPLHLIIFLMLSISYISLRVILLRDLLLPKEPKLTLLKLIKLCLSTICYCSLFYIIYNIIMIIPSLILYTFISYELGSVIIMISLLGMFSSNAFVTVLVTLEKKFDISYIVKKYFTFFFHGIVFIILDILLFILFIASLAISYDHIDMTSTPSKLILPILTTFASLLLFNIFLSSIYASFYEYIEKILRKEKKKNRKEER